MCLQCPKMSVLRLSVASLGLNEILNFSLKHSLHLVFTGLKEGTFLSNILHSKYCSTSVVGFKKKVLKSYQKLCCFSRRKDIKWPWQAWLPFLRFEIQWVSIKIKRHRFANSLQCYNANPGFLLFLFHFK